MTDFAARRTMMVDTQIRPSDVTKFPIIDAMLTVPREAFVPGDYVATAYVGEAVPLDGSRVVLEPRTFAKMLDLANVELDDLVLDIGSGLGYSAAVLARMAEAVVAVEDDEERVEEAQALLSQNGADNVIVHHGPLAEGAAEHGPYDVIMLQGGIAQLPDALAAQVKDGGRIIALFMDGALGTVKIGYKIDGSINWRNAFNATAPLLPGFERERGFVL
ncbi:protein-L-isoaspartate O-methyltransferase family protein [Pseudaestuariivita atlantica]|uniref:Protein-L-isoaspartate O-methyltransferase n=1 Tax=Pseudaestuariivita atlantica TaxID=1317121 RepID=A0A0L1JMT8_9RHOB|nr:protein-L-isoaspartate O-methyltransferase [Pseudaestuariivita atlantica]KNG92728.1 protein-L-isoaspartate O-methyltransferase [Pseudaestuariivita atlantica]